MLEKKSFFQKDFLIIFALGISSSLPLGAIASTLKAFLLEKNFSLEIIGFLSIVMIFYSIKFLFAPFIDSIKLPFLHKKMGRRRSFIFISQIFLIFSIFFLGFFGQKADLSLILFFALVTGFFSSCQDVAIDGYRIEIFDDKNQGLASSFYIFGYRMGLLISGALALFLADKMSWDLVYFFLAFCMILSLIPTFLARKESLNIDSNLTKSGFFAWAKTYLILPIIDFTKKQKWYIILLLIVFFKLTDAFAGSLTAPFLLEIGFSKTQIATIVKTFGLFATLFGVFCGGFLVKKISIYSALFIGILFQMLSNFAFVYLAKIGYNVEFLYFTIFVENLSGGIGDAILVAYLSMLCNLNFSATQYAILSSFAGLSRVLFSSSAGVFVANFGWYNFFLFSIILSIPAFILIIFLKNIKNDKA